MRSLGLAAAFLGCASPSKRAELDTAEVEAIDPMIWSVRSVGPYQVGFSDFVVTYESSPAFPARTIRVNLWYPTVDEEGGRAAYTVGIDERVFQDATPAEPVHAGGYPVHLHSHGFQGYGATSAFLARYFASHGWVTIAPDHTENTIIDHVDPLPSSHYFQRPLDVRESLDAVVEADLLGSPLNVERVIISGHSFGAYTTWSSAGASYDLDRVAEMCATGEGLHADGCTDEEQAMFSTQLSDSRIVASIPMAGVLRRSWFGSSGELTTQGPVLFFGGSEDDRGQQEQFDQMGDIDFTWMELEGACHQSFALGACASLDSELGFSLVQTASLAFARMTVLGDVSEEAVAIATGEQALSDIVMTHRR